MSEKLKESLSAVIDGEADEFELRRVLDEMTRDELLAASWERYHVIGSVLRGERAVLGKTAAGASMRDRVWAELQADPEGAEVSADPGFAVVSDQTPLTGASKRSWTPAAVAATVALAVVLGFMGYSGLEQEPVVEPLAAVDEPVNAQQQSLYDAVALSNEVTDSDQIRTDAYIVRHYQQMGMDRPGLGFARMVAYERD